MRQEDELATQLRLALALARSAGEDAAARFRQIATGNSDPDDVDGFGLRVPGGQWRKRGPAVTNAQVRAAAASFDEFVDAVVVVDRLLDARGTSGNLSAGLAASSGDTGTMAAVVYERVNDTLADLERLRVALVLGRPLTRRDG